MKLDIKNSTIPFNEIMTRTKNFELKMDKQHQFCQSNCQCGGGGNGNGGGGPCNSPRISS